MRKILEELKNQIKNEIGIMPVFAPQQASGNTAMIILSYTGIEAAGERPDDARNTANESITLSAVFSISGTHEKWLNTAILYSRNFIQIIENGTALPYSEAEAAKILSQPEVTVIADVKMGEAGAAAWGCDLTHGYIDINADYRS